MEKTRTIIFASHNVHKVEELRRICGDRFRLLSLADMDCLTDIPEDGTTLAENAEAKARWVYERFGMECFADDTGLEVNALDGAPGVHTARFAGEECDPVANVDKLLHSLEGCNNRSARFRTVIAHIDAGGHLTRFDGTAEGSIAESRRGTAGFGYDPVFIPSCNADGRSFAEMSPDEKNAISHRGRATAQLISFLESTLK